MTCTPPYSYVSYIVNDAQVLNPTFSYAGFKLLDGSVVPEATQIEVYRNGILKTITTQYTVNTTNDTVTLLEPLDVGDFIKIQRVTDHCDRYVNFVNNSIVDEKDMDLSFDQVFFMAQEALDSANDTIRKNVFTSNWDALGIRVTNIGRAIDGGDAVTLNQAYDILSGALTAVGDGALVAGFDGDGVEDTFALPQFPISASSAQLLVTVDGVIQEPSCVADNGQHYGNPALPALPQSADCGAYTVSVVANVLQLVFNTPPANGTSISVRMQTGTFAGRLLDKSITSTQLADGCVGLDQLQFEAGNASRFLSIDADGVATFPVLTAGQITNFVTKVQESKLNNMAAPNGPVSLNNQKITFLTSGTVASDAVNKGQMDTGDAATLASAQAYAANYTDAKVASSAVAKTASGSFTLSTGVPTTITPAGMSWNTLMLSIRQLVDDPAFGAADRTDTLFWHQLAGDGNAEVAWKYKLGYSGGGDSYVLGIQRTNGGASFTVRSKGTVHEDLTVRFMVTSNTN